MPTPLSPERYVATGGSRCPACSSEEITIEVDFNQSTMQAVVQTADCLACGASWSAIYELTGYEDLTIPRKEDV